MKKISLVSLCFTILSLLITSCSVEEHICDYSYIDYDESFHYAMCKEDNTHIVKQEHNYEYVTTLKEATATASGQEQYKCSDCGRIQVKTTSPTSICNYNKEVVADKYLKEKVSEGTSIYYKSDEQGNFGDDSQVFENSLIPEGYTEVSYILNDGTQYIDTGVIGKVGVSSEIKCYFPSVTATQTLLGSRVDKNDTRCYLLQVENSQACIGLENFYIACSTAASKDITYKTVLNSDRQELYCNGVKVYENIVESNYNTGRTLYLFANNYDADKQIAFAKVYYCKIWEEDTLVRNYIPVIRDVDNLPGLYDTVEKKFYETINKAENFTIGEDTNTRDLPSDYQEVEYIESYGMHSINTGLTIGNSSSTHVTMSTNILKYSGTCHWQASGYYMNPGFCIGTISNKIYSTSIKYNFNKKQVIDFYTDYKTYTQSINGIEMISNSSNYAKIDRTAPFTIFSSLYDYNYKYTYCFSNERLYDMKIYQDDILKRDLVPCYRKVDSIAGLYDLVTNSFYCNCHTRLCETGEMVGHKYDITNALIEPSLGINGKVEYICSVCGKKYEKETLPLAYKVDLVKDENVSEIRVLKSDNKDDYSNEYTTYTRNKNTYNYSAIDPIIKLEIITKDGYEVDDIISDEDTTITYKNGIYYIEGFTSNTTLSITAKKSTTK